MKYLLVTFLAVAASAASLTKTTHITEVHNLKASSDIIQCPKPLEAVNLLYSGNVTFDNPTFDSIEEHVYFPAQGVFVAPITCYTVKDQNHPVGNQGLATEIGGGLGATFLELDLLSARGVPINVEVEIYSL